MSELFGTTDKVEPEEETTGLTERLRMMARYAMDDLSIGDEAADYIKELEAELEKTTKSLWLIQRGNIKNDIRGSYYKNTISTKGKNGWNIRCKKGLWSVSHADLSIADREANYYFRKYYEDGEYGED